MYYSQSDNFVYSATGVYRAITPEIAAEWSYLAGMHEGTSSRVPLDGNRFFEITQRGEDRDVLVAGIEDVLAASKVSYIDALEIRAPVTKLESSPRSYYSWLAITSAIAVALLGAIHIAPLLALAPEEDTPQTVYSCPLLSGNHALREYLRAEVAEPADAPGLKPGTH